MNDFTKEELDSILSWACVYNELGASWTYNLEKPLIDKIQHMLDNYCEHDWNNVHISTIDDVWCENCKKYMDKLIGIKWAGELEDDNQ